MVIWESRWEILKGKLKKISFFIDKGSRRSATAVIWNKAAIKNTNIPKPIL